MGQIETEGGGLMYRGNALQLACPFTDCLTMIFINLAFGKVMGIIYFVLLLRTGCSQCCSCPVSHANPNIDMDIHSHLHSAPGNVS